MATPLEILLGLASAAPTFLPDWDRTDPLPYVDVGDLVQHLQRELREGRTEEVAAVFATAERRLATDPDAENFIQIGFFECVQNTSASAGLVQEDFEPFLGPRSAVAWQALNSFWGGSTTPDN